MAGYVDAPDDHDHDQSRREHDERERPRPVSLNPGLEDKAMKRNQLMAAAVQETLKDCVIDPCVQLIMGYAVQSCFYAIGRTGTPFEVFKAVYKYDPAADDWSQQALEDEEAECCCRVDSSLVTVRLPTEHHGSSSDFKLKLQDCHDWQFRFHSPWSPTTQLINVTFAQPVCIDEAVVFKDNQWAVHCRARSTEQLLHWTPSPLAEQRWTATVTAFPIVSDAIARVYFGGQSIYMLPRDGSCICTYEPTDSRTPWHRLNCPVNPSAAVLDLPGVERLLICGGWAHGPIKSYMVYDKTTCKVVYLGDMNEERCNHFLRLVDGHVLAVGGALYDAPPRVTIEEYDVIKDRWLPRTPLGGVGSLLSNVVV